MATCALVYTGMLLSLSKVLGRFTFLTTNGFDFTSPSSFQTQYLCWCALPCILYTHSTPIYKSYHHKGFTLIAAMSLVGAGRGLLGSGLVAAGGSPGTNLYRHTCITKRQVIYKLPMPQI